MMQQAGIDDKCEPASSTEVEMVPQSWSKQHVWGILYCGVEDKPLGIVQWLSGNDPCVRTRAERYTDCLSMCLILN